MHSKQKGNIGQFAIATEFAKLGYSVFTEEGDLSKIDLIAEKDSKLIRVQCKAIYPKNNTLSIPCRKCGPNYQFRYTINMFDFFGLYDLKNYNVYLVPNTVLLTHKSQISLRLVNPKNNQIKKILNANDFLIEKILRDYTHNT